MQSEGLDCFIFDEYIVWVHPFWAVAVGGVKLKMPKDQIDQGEKIIGLVKQGKLVDDNGEYDLETIFENEIRKENKILQLRSQFRKNPSQLDKSFPKIDWLTKSEVDKIIESEREFQKLSNARLDLKMFWYELFDFSRIFFKYLRIRPLEYYLDKDLVDRFNASQDSISFNICPNCESDNVYYGDSMDFEWDVPYLILSFVFGTIFGTFAPFLIRTNKKYHCFNCGHNFRKGKRSYQVK